MKFIAEKAQIVDSLQNAAAVAERRQTIPILANLRLKTCNGKLEVTATDLEIQIKTFSDLIEIEEEGETTVSARKMSSNPKIPGKYFTIGRVFRPDVLDATHLIEFNQLKNFFKI